MTEEIPEYAGRWADEGSDVATNWIAEDDRMNRMHAAFGDRMLTQAALQTGETVIDIGCGTGATCLAAARSVGHSGVVLGVDISPEMLAVAEEHCATAEARDVMLVRDDAQTHDFKPGAADAAISRFGVGHFRDTTAAFTNIRSALRPGGRLVFVEWGGEGDNEWMTILDRVGRRTLPGVPVLRHSHGGGGGHDHGNHGHADEFASADRLRPPLIGAGFEVAVLEAISEPMWFGDSVDDVVDWVMRREAPLSGGFVERGLQHRFAKALGEELKHHADADGVHMKSTAWIVDARVPR